MGTRFDRITTEDNTMNRDVNEEVLIEAEVEANHIKIEVKSI